MEILIYGAGGFAREVAWLVSCHADLRPVAFVDDDQKKHDTVMHDLPILALAEARQRYPRARLVCAVGSPGARERIVRRAETEGCEFASLVHPRIEMSPRVALGDGCIICAGSIVTTDVRIGHHSHINLDCTLGHDAVIGDFATLAPGVHVSGHVTIGARAYVGTGAVIINGTSTRPLVIGDDAIIGAGACVTKDVEPGTTVVGVPAAARPRS